jgi:hypothetical protein
MCTDYSKNCFFTYINNLNIVNKNFYILSLDCLYTENTIFLHFLNFPVVEKFVLFCFYFLTIEYMSFFNNHFASQPLPATIITPTGAVGVEEPQYVTLGANGPTGTNSIHENNAESDDELPAGPLSFDQEQHLLMKMNEQQGKTIEELMARIKVLEKELVEKPVPPICYVKCPHCYESD